MEKKVCKYCGKEFTPNIKKQIYCCRECCNHANYERLKEDPIYKDRMNTYERRYRQEKRDMERKKRLKKIAIKVHNAPSIEVAVEFLDKQINRLNK